MFSNKKTLIVVYKDEMLMNQLRKLIETNDDADDGKKIVGTKDGSINIVSWKEKVWLANKEKGNFAEKILFLGNIKGTEHLIPVIDLKFEKHGVYFGWAGNQAVLYVNVNKLNHKDQYLRFLREFAELPAPKKIRGPKPPQEDPLNNAAYAKILRRGNVIGQARHVLFDGINLAMKAGENVAVQVEDMLRDKKKVKRQMMFYGVIKAYDEYLEQFMNS